MHTLKYLTTPTKKLNTQPQIKLKTTTLNALPEVAQTMTKYNTTHEGTSWIEIEIEE